jgi:hypothetical protein
MLPSVKIQKGRLNPRWRWKPFFQFEISKMSFLQIFLLYILTKNTFFRKKDLRWVQVFHKFIVIWWLRNYSFRKFQNFRASLSFSRSMSMTLYVWFQNMIYNELPIRYFEWIWSEFTVHCWGWGKHKD